MKVLDIIRCPNCGSEIHPSRGAYDNILKQVRDQEFQGELDSYKAEIERLKKECGNQSTLWSKHYEGIFETSMETVKSEAIKEFVERWKKKIFPLDTVYSDGNYPINAKAVKVTIDNLMKEMVGDNE